MRPTVFREPSGLACDSYRLGPEDTGLAAGLGLDTLRFPVVWARVEPAEGEFAAEALARYRAIVGRCRAAGIAPVVTWSLLENFEWVFGFDVRFGLHEADRTTFARRPELSVAVYAAIARANGGSL